MGIVYGMELDALVAIMNDDPVAAAIGEDFCDDDNICSGVAAAKGEDVYAHCGLVVPDTTVD